MKLVLILLLSVASTLSYGAEGCSDLETTLNGVNPSVTAVQYGHPLEGLMIPYYSTQGEVNDTSYLESKCLERADLARLDFPLNKREVVATNLICGVEVFQCNVDDKTIERRRERRRDRRKRAAKNTEKKVVQTFSAVSENPPSASAEDPVGIVSKNPVYAEIIDGEVVYYSGAPVE